MVRKHQKAIKGINLITLYYTDEKQRSFPVNYRIYNKAEGKTKNQYLLEMIDEVIEWGIVAETITTDSWYSSKKNLKSFKEKRLNFQVGIAKNRLVKVEGAKWERVENLDLGENGKIVFLKEFGQVKVFKRTFKNGVTHYWACFKLEESALKKITREDFRELFSIHWRVENYHRALKQLCNIGKFFVRKTEAINTHIFSALRAFCQLEIMRIKEQIESWYELQKNLYLQVARQYIIQHFSSQLAP